jgi:hypothetical protein
MGTKISYGYIRCSHGLIKIANFSPDLAHFVVSVVLFFFK